MPTEVPQVPDRSELERVVEFVVRTACSYLETIDERQVRQSGADEFAEYFDKSLPESGIGAVKALAKLVENGTGAAVHSSGPRFFHFVMGGTTPAALGADWLTTLLDQVAYAWVSSPLALQLEVVSLDWLKDLFGLPKEFSGIMTTGATMANFVGLAAARQWCGEQSGFDISENGLSGVPPINVYSSGYLHASAVKCLGMLGIGRSTVRVLSRDSRGRLDEDRLRQELSSLGPDEPAILIANAGEVNAGDFDPLDTLADLADDHDAWLHVDGAFGLFAGLSPRTEHLVRGADRADSITVDGHKWLNVPYDCGFSFVRDGSVLGRTFAYSADYLPDPDDPRPNMGSLGPESSRRARSLSVWASLCAYGRTGYSRIVERHLDLAQRMAGQVDRAADLERLADVPLNIVCFRYNPGSLDEDALDRLNERLGEALLADGRVYAGTTRFENRVALRPAIVNWRTRPEDIDLFVRVVRELGSTLVP